MFDIHRNGSNITKFKDLVVEYKDLNNTKVLLTDCRCSSGFDTGKANNKAQLLKSGRNKSKQRNR